MKPRACKGMSARINTFPTPPEGLAFGGVRLHFGWIIPGDASREPVPAYHFRIFIAEGTDAGHLNFKVGDTAHVLGCVGHIGYEILEPFRGHGHAWQACRAVAPFVRLFYDAVILTCDPDNHASIRTIERLGAQFVDEVRVPPHDPQYLRGSRRKRRYRWSLE